MVKGICLQAMKIVHYYANSCFDLLISGQQSDNPLREAVSLLSEKYERFTFVHPVNFEKKLKIFKIHDYWINQYLIVD